MAELQSAVKQQADLMDAMTVSFGVVSLSAVFTPFNGGRWAYMIKKGSSAYFTVTFEWMNGAGKTYPIYAQYENGTWTYDALNDKLGNFELVKAVKEPAPGDGNHVAEYMIPANSQRMYMFSALYDPNQGVLALVIVSSNGTIYVQNVTTQYTITATYSDGKLTITIPFGGYCRVSLMRIY